MALTRTDDLKSLLSFNAKFVFYLPFDHSLFTGRISFAVFSCVTFHQRFIYLLWAPLTWLPVFTQLVLWKRSGWKKPRVKSRLSLVTPWEVKVEQLVLEVPNASKELVATWIEVSFLIVFYFVSINFFNDLIYDSYGFVNCQLSYSRLLFRFAETINIFYFFNLIQLIVRSFIVVLLIILISYRYYLLQKIWIFKIMLTFVVVYT